MMRYWLIVALVCLSFPPQCFVSGSSVEYGGSYLHCVVMFHHYMMRSTRFTHDLRERVKCHEDWIDSQEGRIRDLQAGITDLKYENDHLEHVVHILHYHFVHLYHTYVALRNETYQCEEDVKTCLVE